MYDFSMSGKELLQEYSLDLGMLQDMTSRLNNSHYVTKALQKFRKKNQVVVPQVMKTERQNYYLSMMIYDNVRSGRKSVWQFSSFHIALLSSHKGPMAISFYPDCNQVVRYTSHFLERYKERFISTCDDWKTRKELILANNPLEVLAIFMRRNLVMTWIETKTVFHDRTHIFGPINDGVALLHWDRKKRLLQANTFITMEMLNQKQLEMVKWAKMYLSLSESQKKNYQNPDFLNYKL